MLERIDEQLGGFADELAVERLAAGAVLDAQRRARLRMLRQPLVISEVSAPMAEPASAAMAET